MPAHLLPDLLPPALPRHAAVVLLALVQQLDGPAAHQAACGGGRGNDSISGGKIENCDLRSTDALEESLRERLERDEGVLEKEEVLARSDRGRMA